MPSRLRLNPQLAEALARGDAVLTPNQRIARAIRQEFDRDQRSAGSTLWTPPNVLPLEQWLAGQWNRLLLAGQETRVLLNPTQEQALWRSIIAADPETNGLRSLDALANLAARAWNLLWLHRGNGRLREFPLSTDSRAFERWSRAFERRLARSQSITAAELPTALLAYASTSDARTLTLIDFDALPPAHEHLFQTLTESCHARQSLETSTESSPTLHIAEDDATELQVAARWAHSLLQANPQASIAIIVPNIADRRPAIDRVFGPILAPEALPITAPPAAPVYEFSLGRPLAELPMAKAALDLLAWPLQPLPVERVSTLLLSPWFTGTRNEIAAFDAYELRQTSLLRPELTLEAAIRLVELSRRRTTLGDLLPRLRALASTAQATQLADRPGQSEPLCQPFSAWADTFRELLKAAGWASNAPNRSLEFQQLRRWESALDELATLDAVPSPNEPTAPDALAAFTRILQQAVFAPESRNAPIQIMGPLEAGGVAFDALWFLGTDDLNWPAPASASPLLPWQLQRVLGIPGADRARDDAESRALTQRIAHSAAETVFSYARHAEEGDRRPSPLLAALELQPFEPAEPEPTPNPLQLELIEDDVTLPLLPNRPVQGGSHVLKLQAACAFRAFAETRLASTEPGSRQPGLDALERGTLVHAVMENFWSGLPSQAVLRELPLPARDELLNQAIDTAIAKVRAKPESAWDRAYLSIERRRLRALLTPWLDRELARSPFQVLPPEQKKQFQLGPIALDLRIDRMDLTPAGTVILDYKTGLAGPTSWSGDRPDEPQLPLYAVLEAEAGREVAAVAFALLKAGTGLGLKGFAEDPAILGLDRVPAMEAATLADQIVLWRETLTALAEAYAAGDTRVAPKQYPKTCQRCGQRILCRLDPAALTEPIDDEPEGEALYE
jgi:probable DNA repair protein